MSRNTEDKKNPTLAEYLSEGILGRLIVARRLTPATVASYLSTLRKHIVPALGSYRVEELGRQLPPFVAGLSDRQLSPRSVHTVLSVLKRIIDLACEEGVISARLTISAPHVRGEATEHLTEEQGERILGAAANETERLMFSLMCDAGLRIGELTALRWDDFHLPQGMVTVTNRKRRYVGLGQETTFSATRHRSIPLSPRLLSLLSIVRPSSDTYVFTVRDTSGINRRVLAALVRAGIAQDGETTRHGLTAHELRKLFAARLRKGGVPVALIYRWMGWSPDVAKSFGVVRDESMPDEELPRTFEEERALLVAALESVANDKDES